MAMENLVGNYVNELDLQYNIFFETIVFDFQFLGPEIHSRCASGRKKNYFQQKLLEGWVGYPWDQPPLFLCFCKPLLGSNGFCVYRWVGVRTPQISVGRCSSLWSIRGRATPLKFFSNGQKMGGGRVTFSSDFSGLGAQQLDPKSNYLPKRWNMTVFSLSPLNDSKSGDPAMSMFDACCPPPVSPPSPDADAALSQTPPAGSPQAVRFATKVR